MTSLSRRTVIAAGSTLCAAPAIARGTRQHTLICTHDSIAVLDPVLSTADVTRDFGYMVFDTLFGVDSDGNVHPQMAEGHTVEDDGRRIIIALRRGLVFHDGEGVTAADCVASLRRWMARDVFGQKLAELLADITAPSDDRIVLRFRQPFPIAIEALAKFGAIPAFIMPARLAATDPSRPVPEIIGSGPYRFVPAEWNAGNVMVFVANERYSPTPAGPQSMTAGPKLPLMQRVEWRFLNDPSTAAAALQAGEIDWWHNVQHDLKPLLARHRAVTVSRAGDHGSFAYIRPNHLHPPFYDAAARRAVMAAIDQTEFMRALFGEDRDAWTAPVGFFTPGAPMAKRAGFEALAASQAAAREGLARAGVVGAKVTLLAAGDIPIHSTLGVIAADMLRKIGLDVDLAVSDWASLVARRAKREAPAQAGWNAFISTTNGTDTAEPATHRQLRANGLRGWFGWPDIPALERQRDAWFAAPTRAAQTDIAAAMQRTAFTEVPYWPLGHYVVFRAQRNSISGSRTGLTVAWNVRKEA
jgi:peptide/nickel transport system substrate-binding protein